MLNLAPTPMKLSKRRSRWPAILAATLVFGCSAGKSVETAPVATLGQSIAAQQQFKALEQARFDGNERDLQGLEARLVQFIQTFPSDPETNMVRVWLARLRLDKDKLDEAWVLVDQASVEKVGATFDAAQVVKAAVLTRQGQPERSMGILEPLSGRIVDGRERDAWAREIIRAALQLKHDDDALKWALVWRLESSEDQRPSNEREIGLVLDQVSEPALDRLWNQLIAAERIPTTLQSRRQGRVWMREAVVQRLAHSAIAGRDGKLARRLLNDAWPSLQKSGDVRRLTRVAAQDQAEIQNLAKSIGVILELDDTEGRHRSSELLTGILHTLDEYGGGPKVRLQTREAHERDNQGYAEAVEDLCNEGVAILVGGFTEKTAIELAKVAASKGVAAITLAQVESGNEWTFWIDTSDKSVIDLWHKGDSKSTRPSKLVTDTDTDCSGEPPPDVVAKWSTEGLERILLGTSKTCAEMLGLSAANAARLPPIWLGPKALNAADSWRTGAVRGQFNFQGLLAGTNRAQDLEQWQKRFSRLPSYYEVLGHDVAVLSAASLDAFPVSTRADPNSRSKTLREIATRLATAQGSLWSTSSRGFTSSHSLVPEFHAQPAASSDASTLPRNKDKPFQK